VKSVTATVLGIETSCDDTSIAIIRGEKGTWKNIPKILSHVTFGQGELLSKWGGVVPELAARNHVQKIAPLIKIACDEAGIAPGDWDFIGVTTQPGLLGPLLTGIHAAKSLALFFHKPIVAINHLHAHLEAIHLQKIIQYPYLGILTSGGHSLFAYVTGSSEFEILGSTIDDAAGEAFDKGGKMLGLGYPAGKIIDDLSIHGDPNKYPFPIGLHRQDNCNLSYSGVKTSLRLLLENIKKVDQLDLGSIAAPTQQLKDICASYQSAIVEAIAIKTKVALKILRKRSITNIPIVLGGGVACNSFLRKRLSEEFRSVELVAPQFCTDNGAMIAALALRTHELAMPYPTCLEFDAHNRVIERKDFTHG
jgi:N6-L-threonylcarbamoyladenine synthase